MDWEQCRLEKFVKDISKDDDLIKSLQLAADKKIKTADILPWNDITAASKIVLIYDALREVLEAMAIIRGFKIYNHECYYAFLKEIVLEDDFAESFDEFRKLRNAINYYGQDITIDDARNISQEMIMLFNSLNNDINL